MDDDLARRAVACPGWRWLPGMRYTLPTTSLHGRWKPGLSPHIMPDLSDPCTLGGLLALVREAWGCPHLSVVGTSEDWRIDAEGVVGVRDLHSYKSEAEALVAALEAAP